MSYVGGSDVGNIEFSSWLFRQLFMYAQILIVVNFVVVKKFSLSVINPCHEDL